VRRTLSVAWAAGIAGVVVAWSQGCLHKQPAPAVEEEALMPATKSGFVPSPPPPPPEEEAPAEPEPKPEPEE
jgi:hypothetical protein